MMKRLGLTIIVLALLIAFPLIALAEDVLNIDQIQTEVSQWRGLSALEDVDCQITTTDELREKFAGEFEEGLEDINIAEEVYRLLDLMEEGQDLYTILLDLYSGAVAGFYDVETEEIYVVNDTGEPGPVEEVTYAHEYTHALQDQYFDLSALYPNEEDNSDMSLAIESLVEGDASLIELTYYLYGLTSAEQNTYDQSTGDSDGALDAAPEFIQETLMFPYVEGLDFVSTIYQEEGGWTAVNQAYSDLPQSTEQILHPEKYQLRDDPQPVTLPDLESALGGTWAQLDTDVLGELYMRLYLEAFIDTDEATAAAKGWDGDRYVYLKDAENKKLLVLSSIWDSDYDAWEFFDAYTTFVDEKSDGTWNLLLSGTTSGPPRG